MQTKGRYREDRGEKIAMTYLLEMDMIHLQEDESKKFDFIARFKDEPTKNIFIEVKTSQYTSSEIKKRYFPVMRRISRNSKQPALLLFINHRSGDGVFQVIKDNSVSDLIELNTENLAKEISHLKHINR